jgi:hypothetical protein
MNISNPGTVLASGALVLTMIGAGGMQMKKEGVGRDKKVCEILESGEAVTRDQMPKSKLLGQLHFPHLPGNTIDDQIQRCIKLGITPTREKTIAAIRATYLAGEPVEDSLRDDALKGDEK